MDSSVSKFTRLLPLCIRKENGGGNGLNGQSSAASCLAAERGFFRDAGAMDPFKDPFEIQNMNVNLSPSAPGAGSEQKEVVRVSVTYPSPSCGAMNPHKEIALRLTNDDNPMFFYHLRITEADYPLIKSQQGLLVDFYGFPNQLVTLLERCDPNSVGDGDESKGLGSGGPKFVLVMKIGMHSVLDIVESNPFKYLCHLSLQINPGTDTEVKKYLADVTTGLKKECGLWQEKYSHLSSAMETELTRVKGLLQLKNDELTKLRDDIHCQANSLSSKHFQDMTVEKEKLLKMQSDLASKFESERLEIDRRHSQAMSNLENRIATLEVENRDLIQIKFKNETTVQESAKKIKHLEDDLKVLQQEITLSRKQNEKLDKDYHEKHRLVNSLQNRLAVVESDLKEKQNTTQRQQDYIAQISEQKKFLEDHATNMVKEVEKLKSVNKSVSSELIKANEIIKKLQDDIRSLHTKNKLQGQITLEQERIISDRDKQIHQLEESMKKQQVTMASLEDNEAHAKQELEEAKTKIDTLETTVKSNENMISWLNKQLNEFQGLGNLTKFRQNLAAGGSGSGGPSTAALLGRSNSNTQEQIGQANNSTTAVNGSIRSGGLFASNFQNTLPNGTPSWMHIYQSTSTPLDNDLSSRFERISATNNNYSLGRSRLDTISEKTGETNFTERNNGVSNANQEENRNSNGNQKQATIESTLAAPTNKTTKPPTWAKPRSGKVTLEAGAPTKPNPIWRK
ncbi:Spindle assembly abnormal protein 6 [Orchesella cincta]|uniref:Spindle assembly abnormal protein 6 n=1 Tax=Orchesella cincta TaxID=48709 RepID=A0A1D2MVM2_ORCCI|nr:Spindle assembly abnormal protein 6 [Orchesella cincta]